MEYAEQALSVSGDEASTRIPRLVLGGVLFEWDQLIEAENMIVPLENAADHSGVLFFRCNLLKSQIRSARGKDRE